MLQLALLLSPHPCPPPWQEWCGRTRGISTTSRLSPDRQRSGRASSACGRGRGARLPPRSATPRGGALACGSAPSTPRRPPPSSTSPSTACGSRWRRSRSPAALGTAAPLSSRSSGGTPSARAGGAEGSPGRAWTTAQDLQPPCQCSDVSATAEMAVPQQQVTAASCQVRCGVLELEDLGADYLDELLRTSCELAAG
ncbi:hypothetical protein PVAP13_7KG073209 [Panicum virgatum]|uniref:Uncharacterized protein n=1 Tax=Panicum virgatum TaxID=38727 RepID=A0A8T0QAD7_PANVG|nr:hypothetical protein PVAP13_7KG073209 [Panicum virgatum]